MSDSPPLLSFLLSSRGASPHLNLSLAPSPRAMWDLSTWLAQAWWRHRSSPTPICSAALDCRHSVQQQRSESAAGFITVGERCRFTSVLSDFIGSFIPRLSLVLISVPLVPAVSNHLVTIATGGRWSGRCSRSFPPWLSAWGSVYECDQTIRSCFYWSFCQRSWMMQHQCEPSGLKAFPCSANRR